MANPTDAPAVFELEPVADPDQKVNFGGGVDGGDGADAFSFSAPTPTLVDDVVLRILTFVPTRTLLQVACASRSWNVILTANSHADRLLYQPRCAPATTLPVPWIPSWREYLRRCHVWRRALPKILTGTASESRPCVRVEYGRDADPHGGDDEVGKGDEGTPGWMGANGAEWQHLMFHRGGWKGLSPIVRTGGILMADGQLIDLRARHPAWKSNYVHPQLIQRGNVVTEGLRSPYAGCARLVGRHIVGCAFQRVDDGPGAEFMEVDLSWVKDVAMVEWCGEKLVVFAGFELIMWDVTSGVGGSRDKGGSAGTAGALLDDGPRPRWRRPLGRMVEDVIVTEDFVVVMLLDGTLVVEVYYASDGELYASFCVNDLPPSANCNPSLSFLSLLNLVLVYEGEDDDGGIFLVYYQVDLGIENVEGDGKVRGSAVRRIVAPPTGRLRATELATDDTASVLLIGQQSEHGRVAEVVHLDGAVHSHVLRFEDKGRSLPASTKFAGWLVSKSPGPQGELVATYLWHKSARPQA
ncbi:hypothetical protein HK101_003921, partial [Irineochytrium annulatum]